MKNFKHAVQSLGLVPYENSFEAVDDAQFVMAKDGHTRVLVVGGSAKPLFLGETRGELLIAPLSVDNAKALGNFFPYTIPVRRPAAKAFSMGFGDRLGLASPGHIEAVKDYPVFPVFAQQSIRELNLTRRNYAEVVAAASFAVFQEGYKDGFGADGDHLKTKDEIRYAVENGMTMITLDLSDHIHTEVNAYSIDEVNEAYLALSSEIKERYESKYLRTGLPVEIAEADLRRAVLTFHDAISYAIEIDAYFKTLGADVDLEVSIDETPKSTSPTEHFVIANELVEAKVSISSMAPHFCGSFEKAVDYEGDIEQFTVELGVHTTIADHFGYRLSLHSGSDKFTVFPIWGEFTKMSCHVKVAGTNWLEALRVLARVNKPLFRDTLAFAIENRKTAEQYYHISSKLEDIVPLAKREDAELELYLDEDAARQTLHITYGLLLDQTFFREEFFATLAENEALYKEFLEKHMRKHLDLLFSRVN